MDDTNISNYDGEVIGRGALVTSRELMTNEDYSFSDLKEKCEKCVHKKRTRIHKRKCIIYV